MQLEPGLARGDHHLGGRGQADPVQEVVQQLRRVAGPALAHVVDARAERRRAAGATRSSAASEPPAMIVSVPCSAAAAPPEMPASTSSTPRSPSRRCSSTVDDGDDVLRSTTTWPGAGGAEDPVVAEDDRARRPGCPGSESRTTSAGLGDRRRARPPAVAPASAALRRVDVEAEHVGWPAATIRRAIRPPMLPEPDDADRRHATRAPRARRRARGSGSSPRGRGRRRAPRPARPPARGRSA